MTHPYSNLNDYQFWYKSITSLAPGHIDPVVSCKNINSTDKIATMGSCFAQHLSKNIAKQGFNYYVAEANERLEKSEAVKRNYGVFSARYGNVYTVKQALQLYDRAYGAIEHDNHIWKHNNVFVDAFRPQIEPNGFQSEAELIFDRKTHLSCVKSVFEDSDWLIFTLGLTEAWRSKKDGMIFPVAPGVSGGNFSQNDHEFVNFSIYEVIDDLRLFIEKLKITNPRIKILLTVSPVPLIATYENRHVLVSTTLSKSILRAAVDVCEREFSDVIYFPSYEIITSQSNDGRYYEDDFRQVTDIGVNHVMRLFSKHFLRNKGDVKTTIPFLMSSSVLAQTEIVCDEELIELAIKKSGF